MDNRQIFEMADRLRDLKERKKENPCGIRFSDVVPLQSPSEGSSALSASDLSGESVRSGVLSGTALDAVVRNPFTEKLLNPVELLSGHNRLVVTADQKHLPFPAVAFPFEILRIGLLEQAVPDVLLVSEHRGDGTRAPSSAFSRSYSFLFQNPADLPYAFSREVFPENQSYCIRLLRDNGEAAVLDTVAQRSVSDLVSAVTEASEACPLVVFRV